MPPELSLAKQSGVSRSTVREALRTLEQAGLVERVSPRVMTVRRSEDAAYRVLIHELRRRNVTFHHLHEALLMLDPELSRLAAERADADDIGLLHDLVAAQERKLDRFTEWNRLDVDFHLAIAEMSGNPALIIARAPLTQVLIPTLDRFMNSTWLTGHATDFHRRIVAEIEAGDPDTAAAVTRRHVNDFGVAWEKAGRSFDEQIADLGDERDRSGADGLL